MNRKKFTKKDWLSQPMALLLIMLLISPLMIIASVARRCGVGSLFSKECLTSDNIFASLKVVVIVWVIIAVCFLFTAIRDSNKRKRDSRPG